MSRWRDKINRYESIFIDDSLNDVKLFIILSTLEDELTLCNRNIERITAYLRVHSSNDIIDAIIKTANETDMADTLIYQFDFSIKETKIIKQMPIKYLDEGYRKKLNTKLKHYKTELLELQKVHAKYGCGMDSNNYGIKYKDKRAFECYLKAAEQGEELALKALEFMERSEDISMKAREDKLFEKWVQEKDYGNLFVKDGVPCPEMFEKEEIKITFVLKEANASDESGFDMRQWIDCYGGCSATWNNITRWTQAILDRGDYVEKISSKDRIHWLKKISFLNLKKIGGGSSSAPSEIKEFAESDAEYIRDQLNIYEPDIIVGCGVLGNKTVADCLGDFSFHYKGEWKHYEEDDFFCWFYIQIPGKTKRTAVLNFYHPLNVGTGYKNRELFDVILKISPKMLEGR